MSSLSSDPSGLDSPSADSHTLPPNDIPQTPTMSLRKKKSFFGRRSSKVSKAGSEASSSRLDVGSNSSRSERPNVPPVPEVPPAPQVPQQPTDQKVEVSLINLGFARFYKVKVTGPNGKKVGYTPAPRPPRKPRA